MENAVSALYYSQNDTERQSAMHWLEQLQNSQEAWPVSINCLSNFNTSSPEVAFFAAQTLKHKVVSDLSQLDPQGVLNVFKLLQQLCYHQHGLPKPLKTQLLLALAALYVQSHLPLESGGDERVYVQLLSVIPEQLNNRLIHLSEDHFNERRQTLLLANSSSAIPMFLKALQDDDSMKKIGVEGLQNWIHYAELTCEQSIHIFQVAVRLLTEESEDHEELVEGACEMICELVYQNTKHHSFYASFVHYLPHLCNLLSSTIEDANLKAIGSMLVECSELYLTSLLESPDVLTCLIPALLKLSSHSDREIVELTFNFWTELEVILENCPQSLRDAFSPVYTNLFGLLLPRMQYPSDNVRFNAEEKETFRDFRHMIGDCLKDCVRVIGSTAAIELLMQALQQAMKTNSWQPVEACLFALRTISSVIDRRESEKLPGLFPILLSLNSHPKLVYSTLLVIGCLADWIKYHMESLQPSVEYIARGLTHRGDSSITTASAMAMRYLCESCSNLMVPIVNQLLDLYSKIIQSGELESKEDQLALTESICHVIIAEGADTSILLPRAVSWFVEKLNEQSRQNDMCCILEHLSLFVELVVPESVSAISPAWPMTSIYLDSIEPRILELCTTFGVTLDEGLSSLLRSAISKYTRGLGQKWLYNLVRLCHSLFSANYFPSALSVLRYAVLLGECNESVQQVILKDLNDHFKHYASQTLDCLNLMVSIYDYWKGIEEEEETLVSKAIHLATCVVSDPSAPVAELTASIILTLRIGVSRPALLSRPDYTELLTSIIRSALLLFPLQAQPDCATLLHRIGRNSNGIIEKLFLHVLSTTTLNGLVSEREQQVWAQQCTDALKESRPKSLKNALNTWAAAVRRRLPRATISSSSQSGSIGSISSSI